MLHTQVYACVFQFHLQENFANLKHEIEKFVIMYIFLFPSHTHCITLILGIVNLLKSKNIAQKCSF